MTHTAEQGLEAISAAGMNKRIVQVGSSEPSSVIYQSARTLIAEGYIGAVHTVESVLDQQDGLNLPFEREANNVGISPPDHAVMVGAPLPTAAGGSAYHNKSSCPEKVLFASPMIHHITGLHYVLRLDGPPLMTFTHKSGVRNGYGDYPGTLASICTYHDNLMVTMRLAQDSHTEPLLRFLGTRGTIEIYGLIPESFTLTTRSSPTWTRQREHLHEGDEAGCYLAKALAANETVSFYAPPQHDSNFNHICRFFQAVRSRSPHTDDPYLGHHAATAVRMAELSYQHSAVATWRRDLNRIVV